MVRPVADAAVSPGALVPELLILQRRAYGPDLGGCGCLLAGKCRGVLGAGVSAAFNGMSSGHPIPTLGSRADDDRGGFWCPYSHRIVSFDKTKFPTGSSARRRSKFWAPKDYFFGSHGSGWEVYEATAHASKPVASDISQYKG